MRWFVLLGLLVACAGGKDSGSSGGDGCEACLLDGGTWQPEADACTEGCALQDISCFSDECPGACEAGACDNCFSQTECEAAECEWKIEAEAAWCVSA